MGTVAQKTLFFTILTLFYTFLALFNNSFAQNIPSQEILTYKINLNGLNLGNAVLNFNSQQKGAYKLTASAKTEGMAKILYDIDDKLTSYGTINKNKLKPTSQVISLDEAGYKANKSVKFNFDDNLIEVINNKDNSKKTLVMLNQARDILSTMYSLRFNEPLNKEEGKTIKTTTQFLDKTIKNTISVSKPFNYKVSKNNHISARSVVVKSQRIGLNELTENDLLMIKEEKKKALNFLNKSLTKKEYKEEQNFKVIITNDSSRLPIAIEYVTKFGTFKAKLTKRS